MQQNQDHYFYALELPKEIKSELKEVCEILRGTLLFKRWVYYEDFHITLAFLGAAKEDSLALSIDKLKSENRLEPFFLSIDHLGTFGKEDWPRIFWAGVKTQPLLGQIREVVYEACVASGFKLETRSFNPHITLARKWVGDTTFNKSILIEENPFSSQPLIFQAGNIVLYKTHIGKEPKYEPIAVFPLKNNG